MNKLMIKLIEWYQKRLSPLNQTKCRYTPTCSEYGKECYKRFNFFKATFLTVTRILRCNPLFKPRHDPVPEKRVKKRKHEMPSSNTHEQTK